MPQFEIGLIRTKRQVAVVEESATVVISVPSETAALQALRDALAEDRELLAALDEEFWERDEPKIVATDVTGPAEIEEVRQFRENEMYEGSALFYRVTLDGKLDEYD